MFALGSPEWPANPYRGSKLAKRHMNLHLRLDVAQRVTRTLTAIVLILVTLSMCGQVSKYIFGHPKLMGFVPLFCVDEESNVPTWYSSVALLIAAAMLAVIALLHRHKGDRYAIHWALLAIVFLGLSMDEIAMLHELPIEPLRRALSAKGLLYYTWVIPGAIFAGAVAVIFRGFLWQLPPATRRAFLVAGITFLAGALGVEMLSGYQAYRYGEQNLPYAITTTIEELLEMTGIVIFIDALVGYLPHVVDVVHVRIGPNPTT